MMRASHMKNIWKFSDMHNEHEAPAHVHRLPALDLKHINSIGESLVITNNKESNVDVYGIDSDFIIKTLNIQGREMNCSIVTQDRVYIGTKDRRIFVYTKRNLDYLSVIEVPETVHCMCNLEDQTKVAVGMTDGHVWIIDASDNVADRVLLKSQFRETGGIWSICGVNQDTELALGTISGVHMVAIEALGMKRTDEHYLKTSNVWNV